MFTVSVKTLSSKLADWVDVLRIVYSSTTASNLLPNRNLLIEARSPCPFLIDRA